MRCYRRTQASNNPALLFLPLCNTRHKQDNRYVQIKTVSRHSLFGRRSLRYDDRRVRTVYVGCGHAYTQVSYALDFDCECLLCSIQPDQNVRSCDLFDQPALNNLCL